MDWITFTSKVIDALAWPLATLFIALKFKDRLLELIDGIKKLKWGELEAEILRETDQAVRDASRVEQERQMSSTPAEPQSQQDSGAAKNPASEPKEPYSPPEAAVFRLEDVHNPLLFPLLRGYSELKHLAHQRPSAAILEAWRNVESVLMLYVGDKYLYSQTGMEHDISKIVGFVDLPFYLKSLLMSLFSVRNSVATAAGYEPTKQAASTYVDNANTVVGELYNRLSAFGKQTFSREAKN